MNKIAIRCGFIALCLLPWLAVAAGLKQEKLAIDTAAGQRVFTVEVAQTPQEQEYGLMNRTMLPRDRGMLFPMSHDADIEMWMKDTKLPLDMLFIDKTGRIVYIKDSAKPESTDIIQAHKTSRAVLELLGGTASIDGIKVGDRITAAEFAP